MNELRRTGRPKGSRNRLQKAFVDAIAKDFEEHGEGIIRIVRTEEPAVYLKLIASILPKEFLVEAREVEHMTDEEIRTALDALSRMTDRDKLDDADVIH
jgi:hypothetical protein